MKLFLIDGRRSVYVDVNFEKVDLNRPIAQRNVAYAILEAKRQITMPRGLTRMGRAS